MGNKFIPQLLKIENNIAADKRILLAPAEPISFYLFSQKYDDEMGNYPITSHTSGFSTNRHGSANSAADFANTKLTIPIQTINNTYDFTISMWVKIRNTNIANIMFLSVYKQGVSDNFLLISFQSVASTMTTPALVYANWLSPTPGVV